MQGQCIPLTFKTLRLKNGFEISSQSAETEKGEIHVVGGQMKNSDSEIKERYR